MSTCKVEVQRDDFYTNAQISVRKQSKVEEDHEMSGVHHDM